jgi:ABC-type glycerol-3-phosphate transport system substrate-binding protein
MAACVPPQAPVAAPVLQPTEGAAGAAAETAAEPVTIEIWDFQQSDKNILDAQNKAIAEFQKENPNIKVNVTVFPIAEYRDKLLVAVQGGKPPDISTLDQIWMAQWAASGAIIPLDDYIEASGVNKDDFFPGAWSSNVWQGQTWGVPLNNDVWEQLYYNKDLFTAAGLDPEKPPTNWDELLAAAEKLNQPPNQYGICIMGTGEWASCIMDSFIYSNGGSVLDAEGNKAVINSPEAVEALTYLQKLNAFAPEGTGSRDEAACIGSFTSGQSAMVLAGSWQQDTFKGKPELNWGVAMVPAPAGKTFHGTLGGWNMSIYNASQHKDEAWKYVEFLTKKDVQKTVNSLIPARLDAGKEFIDEGREGAQIIYDTVNNGYPRPLSKVYFDVSKAQQDMMSSIWQGGDVQEAADQAATTIDEALASE